MKENIDKSNIPIEVSNVQAQDMIDKQDYKVLQESFVINQNLILDLD